MSETSEIVPVAEASQGAEVLAGAWSVEKHLSPLALFEPNRTSICAQYQLALVDDAANEARAHILAARRHLQAALKAPGLNSGRTTLPGDVLKGLCNALDKVARGWD